MYIYFSSEQRGALGVLSQVGGELCGGSEQSLITKPHRRGMGIWEQGLFHIDVTRREFRKEKQLEAGCKIL